MKKEDNQEKISENEETSIAEIDAKIEALKKQKRTKAQEAELKRLKKLLNRIYVECKRKLLEFEARNDYAIAMVRSTNGFYKIFGNSVFFYAFDVAEKLGMKVNVYADSDYDPKSKTGVVSISRYDEVVEQMKTLDIKKMPTHDKSGNLVWFLLPWKYTQEEIKAFEEVNSIEAHMYNHVIVTDDASPALFVQLEVLAKAMYENVRRLDPVARETLGNVALEKTAFMIRAYIETSNMRLTEREGFLAIQKALNFVKSQVKIIVDLKLWNGKTYARIGDAILTTQKLLNLELGKKDGEEV